MHPRLPQRVLVIDFVHDRAVVQAYTFVRYSCGGNPGTSFYCKHFAQLELLLWKCTICQLFFFLKNANFGRIVRIILKTMAKFYATYS